MLLVTVAAAAAQILSNTLTALNAVRERAKTSKDTNLKDHISTLYDNVLSLKEVVKRLTEENGELRRRITELERPPQKQEPELRQVGSASYYDEGDKGPRCQPCDDGKGSYSLTPPERWSGGVRRQGTLCGEYFYEKPMDLSPIRLGWETRAIELDES